jgi:hypothetical protein
MESAASNSTDYRFIQMLRVPDLLKVGNLGASLVAQNCFRWYQYPFAFPSLHSLLASVILVVGSNQMPLSLHSNHF